MIRRQFISYAIIGLVLNATLYGAFLLLTYAGMSSLAAMTLTYVTGVLSGFALNRRITFRYQGGNSGALLRYIASYAIGYAINFAVLWILVVRADQSHQIVQGCMTVVLPVVLFTLQKYWVFRTRPYGKAPFALRSLP